MEENMADAKIEATVKEALEMFRPQLQADGGDMEYVGIDDEMKVHLNLTGACGSCPMALMTLKMGIERYLKDACPEIKEVVQDNAVNYGEGFDF
jgi:Fe-S cluster biogenesis protein NfuA